MPSRRLSVLLLVGIASAFIAVGVVAFTGRTLLIASLPRTGGVVLTSEVHYPVRVQRDPKGVLSIKAESLEDLAFALGFVHAQDRFFQMDLLRRNGAGRLSELLGSASVGRDRQMRTFQYERIADQVLQHLPQTHISQLRAYSAGVNHGLRDLGARPPEYLLLRSTPSPWSERDCLLVAFSMHEMLSMGLHFEKQRAVMAAALPPEVVSLLTPETTRFDVLADGTKASDYSKLSIPEESVFNVRAADAGEPLTQADCVEVDPPRLAMGSNNWVVGGRLTYDGRAILANDMHLSLGIPNIWYRVAFEWNSRTAAGVSLPGFPSLVAGATDTIAWGFTNTSGDFEDLVLVEEDSASADRYQTPAGWQNFEKRFEQIGVRGGRDESLTILKTMWGPVVDEDVDGRKRALKWVALEPECINMRLLDMLEARTLEDAISIGRSWYGPSQNMLIAARDGRIGWVVTGWLPNRVGFDGSVPESWADGARRWDGPLDESLRPTLIDPDSGFITTANHRTLPRSHARVIGTHWSHPVRAARASALLKRSGTAGFREQSLFEIALDTRTEIFDQYQELAKRVAADASIEETLREELRLVNAWSGRAGADDRAFAILTRFRTNIHEAILRPLVARCQERDAHFRYAWFTAEETVSRILEERPAHFLPPQFDTWDELLKRSFQQACESLSARSGSAGATPAWGDINRASIEHLFASSLPLIGRWLELPQDPLPGHASALRVLSPRFGASERMAISPSGLAEGLLHMPGGQSGHPLSKHFADGHAAWVAGSPEPALPSVFVSTFTIQPPPSGTAQ